MKTRDRILATALRLFNESGTGAVSTNHIADELGISPGNLYYYFRNKEQIIGALFEQLFERWDQIFALTDDHMPTLGDLLRMVEQNFALLPQFRFIYRELIALLRRDPALHARWVAIRARGFAGFRELITAFSAAGVLRPFDSDAEIERLAELCWLVSEFWVPSLEVSGAPVDDAGRSHGVELMLQLLRPYMA